HVKVVNNDMALVEHALTPEAQKILATDREQFFDTCGDAFVSQKTEGGEFYAVVEFKSRSKEHKKKVQAKIRASGGTWRLGANVQQIMESLAQIAETNVRLIRFGGSGALPELGSPEDGEYSSLIDYALGFPAIVAPGNDKAWVIAYTVEDY